MRIAALLLLSSVALLGQIVPGRYVLELSGSPAATTPAARVSGLQSRRANVRQLQSTARAAVAARGGAVVTSLDTVLNALVVEIPDARAAELMQVPGAVRLHPVRRVRAALDHALPLHKVFDAWSMLPQGQNSAGAGVKIAMIDSGIDVNHPGFAVALPALHGFPKALSPGDMQFTNAKIIVANNYTTLLPDHGDPDADDHDGHGTGTSMVAAGGPATSPFAPIIGVAPMAYLGNYKVLGAKGATSDVIAKAIDDAVADGMDVINLSLGGYVVDSSQIDPADIGMAAINAATRAGVIVTVAAGNSGPGGSSLLDYATAPSAISAGAIMNDRLLGYAVTLAGGTPYQAFIGDSADPGTLVSGPLFDVAQLDPTGLACSPLNSGSVTGQIVLVLRGTCTFESKLNNAAAGGALAVLLYNSATGTAWQDGPPTVGAATLPAMFISNRDGLDVKAKLAAASSAPQVSLDFTGAAAFPARPDLTSFSSRGPSLGSALKPDLVAVGEEMVTAAQKTYANGESYAKSGFIDTAGTSFSAPLAAGAAAVLKGARPGLTVGQYRSLLINSAVPANAAPNQPATVSQAGAGVLNLAAALGSTIAANPTGLNFGVGFIGPHSLRLRHLRRNPTGVNFDSGFGVVNSTASLTLTNLASTGDTFSITAVPANGAAPVPATSTIHLDPNGSGQVSLALDAVGLAPGEYQGTLQIAGSTGAVAKVPYWYAVPGDAPAGISVLYQDYFDSARTLSVGAIVFRVVDVAGLPYTGDTIPTATIASGGGSIRSVYLAGDIPGSYAIDLRTGTTTMEVDIAIDGITQPVYIPVQ